MLQIPLPRGSIDCADRVEVDVFHVFDSRIAEPEIIQEPLHRLSHAGEWDHMGSLIDDEILNEFAVVAPVGDVAKRVRERCDGVIDRVLVGFPATIDEATASAVVQEMRNNA